MKNHALLLFSGLLASLSCAAAPPASGTPANELTVPIKRHQATCPQPGAVPCAIRKPVSMPYRVLTAGVDIEDGGDYWLVTFAKTQAKGTTLRVLGGNGELHEIAIRFSAVR
jgi:hypothetical protein